MLFPGDQRCTVIELWRGRISGFGGWGRGLGQLDPSSLALARGVRCDGAVRPERRWLSSFQEEDGKEVIRMARSGERVQVCAATNMMGWRSNCSILVLVHLTRIQVHPVPPHNVCQTAVPRALCLLYFYLRLAEPASLLWVPV